MANEVRVTSVLQIRNGALDYQSRPAGFTADMSSNKGPCVGALTVSAPWTDPITEVDYPVTIIRLTEATSPGFARFLNLDATYGIEVGQYDAANGIFYPFLELGPGQSYVIKLSTSLTLETLGTGSGTSLTDGIPNGGASIPSGLSGNGTTTGAGLTMGQSSGTLLVAWDCGFLADGTATINLQESSDGLSWTNVAGQAFPTHTGELENETVYRYVRYTKQYVRAQLIIAGLTGDSYQCVYLIGGERGTTHLAARPLTSGQTPFLSVEVFNR